MTEGGRVVSAAGRSPRRDEERGQAILRATYELLGEVGYQGLRVDAVAARAQASKATLYRHWPTKPGLVLDAVKFCRAPGGPIPDTGHLRSDLLSLFDGMARTITGDEGRILSGLIMAMNNDPGLAEQLRDLRITGLPHAAAICARAETRGELNPGHNPGLIDEITPAVIFMHHFALGKPIDEPFLTHLTDDIILPLLTRKPQS